MIEISDYRTQLYDYLKNRMMAIAPNLTVMVGELVGARLIAHAGMMDPELPYCVLTGTKWYLTDKLVCVYNTKRLSFVGED